MNGEEKKNLLPLPVFEARVRPARSLVTILTYKIMTNVLCYFILY